MGKFDSLSNTEIVDIFHTVMALYRWVNETLDEFDATFKTPRVRVKDLIRTGRESVAFFRSFKPPLDLHGIKRYIGTPLYSSLVQWQTVSPTNLSEFMEYYSMLILLSKEIKLLRSELEDYI